MATTVLQVLNDAAYRLGENANPDNNYEQTRRISYLNQAIRHILRKRYWWFLEKEYSTQTVANQDIYDLPTDFRDSIELRVDSKLVTYNAQWAALSTWDRPRDTYPAIGSDSYYYIFNNDIYLVPEASSAPTSYSVSSITVSGTVATVTTTSAHGLEIDDYVTIAGTSTTEFDTSHQVTSVPSTTTYTITVTAGTSDPSGTITSTQNNMVLKYWYEPTAMSATTDNVPIPDPYIDALSAYIFARVAQLDSERGDASDGFDEFNEIVDQMVVANNKRGSWGKSVNAI